MEIGLASTDELYFASGALGLPGAMFTASHNPARYNGIKLCRAGAAPVGQDTGLREIRDLVQGCLVAGLPPHDGPVGTIASRDVLPDYARLPESLVDLSGIRPLSRGRRRRQRDGRPHRPDRARRAAARPCTPLYFELDGSFPNHEANPIEPANLVDLQAEVRARGADLGLAFDGDADRCFVVDETRRRSVDPSTLTALIAVRELATSRARRSSTT